MSSPIADLEPASPLPPPPKRYIIRLKPQVDRDAHLQGHLEKFSSHDFELHHTLDHRNVYAATISAAVLAREFQLGPDSPIEAIREDHEMRISDVSWSRKVKSWGLARINRDAKLTGSGEWNYHYDNTLETGKGINVYIIDTGRFLQWRLQALKQHDDDVPYQESTALTLIFKAECNLLGFMRITKRCVGEPPAIYDYQDVYISLRKGDSNGHGTHVAGTIGGSTHGVAPAATLHDVKALNDSGTGWSSVITKAMEWVLDNATLPAVVNMSFEGSDDEDQKEYVEELTEKGIHVVVVAGNAGTDAKATSPANAPTAVTVGATNEDDEKWTSSNTGTCLDLLAPGVDIPSCGTANVNAFVEKSGTSMAAPHVSGIIASILSLSEANQKWSPKEMKGVLVALSVKDALTKLGPGTPNRLARGCLHSSIKMTLKNSLAGVFTLTSSGPIVNKVDGMSDTHASVRDENKAVRLLYKKTEVAKDDPKAIDGVMAIVSPTRKSDILIFLHNVAYKDDDKDAEKDKVEASVKVVFGPTSKEPKGKKAETFTYKECEVGDEAF